MHHYFPSTMIKLIYARDLVSGIGINNKLPWHIPSDLKRFKQLTTGQIVVMGRKTYDSLPDRFKPLPNRLNVVLSKTTKIDHPQVDTFSDFSDLLKLTEDPNSKYYGKDIWIIGGSSVYHSLISHVQEVHETVIQEVYLADSFFYLQNYGLNLHLEYQENLYPLPEKNSEPNTTYNRYTVIP